MGPQRWKIMTALLAFVLVVAACGSDDDEETGSADTAGLSNAEQSFEEGESFDDEAAEELSADEAPVAPSSGGAATTTTAPASSAAEDAANSGGLFGPEAEAPDADETAANTFADYGIRPFVATEEDPLSTFALDVDTASYSIARQFADGSGRLPPPESVRVEEYVNSFDYDYRAPTDGLAVEADAGPSPFTPGNVVVRLGVQAEQVADDDRPDATLTFVVDTSGSMDRGNRIGLVRTALSRLVDELGPADQVAIVTYSDGAEVLLPPTSVEERAVILDAIERLRTTGSTNLEAGLQRGYDLANEAFVPGGINRVILASDGVANVGLVDPDGLVELIRGDADRGIHLVTVGVGLGNFNDVTMERLANDGDGFYAYVNTQDEADALFRDDLVGSLLTVAIDGKVQVAFDPDTVAEYRLLGYENRAVLDDDFRNDEVDAGELGAGHQATALYELVLRGGVSAQDTLGTVQLRWQDPDSGSVIENRLELTGAILEDRWTATSPDYRLAVTVASLAEVLRESPHRGEVDLGRILDEADLLVEDHDGATDVADFRRLVRDLI